MAAAVRGLQRRPGRCGTLHKRGRAWVAGRSKLPTFETGQMLATRRAINACVRASADVVPGLVAGAADLTGNTGMLLPDPTPQSREHPEGRQIYYGIREHGMGGVMTGMACHGGVLPVGGTFFVFSDYMRGAVRLAALSRAHVIYSWTHDSIGLGQDGPTHQPVEQLASLRAMPGLTVVRPADANETAQAWRQAVDGEVPIALILSRQDLPVLEATAQLGVEGVARGAYVLVGEDGDEPPDVVLLATGSEVYLCVDAVEELGKIGVRARVVSFPCWEWFEDQEEAYRTSVLPVGRPQVVGRGSCFLRMGSLRRCQCLDRHLRRIGTRRGGAGRVRLHSRERGRSGGSAGPIHRDEMSQSGAGGRDRTSALPSRAP